MTGEIIILFIYFFWFQSKNIYSLQKSYFKWKIE